MAMKERIRQMTFQKRRKTFCSGRPTVHSQISAPSPSPAVGTSRISPRQMPKLRIPHAHSAAATKIRSAGVVKRRRRGRKKPYSSPSPPPSVSPIRNRAAACAGGVIRTGGAGQSLPAGVLHSSGRKWYRPHPPDLRPVKGSSVSDPCPV